MNTCFLFTKNLDDAGCFCLKLSPTGELIAALAQRHFAEIKELQKDSKTTVIETSEHTSIFDLALPWLPERKARVAIPYALEDKLTQAIEELHFSFDKQRYQNNHYLITVISKHRIQYIMQLLADNNITFATMTIDWFALAPQELVVSESTLLIHNEDFKGALTGDLALTYLKKHPLNPTLVFQDSQIATDNSPPQRAEHSFVWIAQQILKTKPLNLCQGDIKQGTESAWIKKGYQLSAALFGAWLLSLLLVNALTLHSLNKKTNAIDMQIAAIYHQFFPEAKQVISPKFRISQLLDANTSDNNHAHFWFLLNQFSKGMKGSPLTVEQLHYQNKTLLVTLVSTDFASLENLENQLKTLQLKIKQTQASTHDQQVIATLEIES
ncbi:MAG: type II secretion system protein GspL [Legionellales bacterium]